jgi:TonB family protein
LVFTLLTNLTFYMMLSTLPMYLLEVNSCLLAFYLFYYLFLRKEKFFGWNRLFIAGAVVLSLALPLIEIPLPGRVSYLPESAELPVLTIFAADEAEWLPTPVTAAATGQEQELTLTEGIWCIYVSICLLLFGRLLWQVARLLHFGYTHTRAEHRQYRLIDTHGKLPTFSFFRMLFWDNSQQLSETQQALILQHELTHIRQWHSADALLLELLKVVCWFNPAVYLLRKSLEEVHEYLADAAVTRHHDARQYSQVMVEQLFRHMNFTVAQSFNRSLINKRIAMIQTNKLPKPAFWKLALSLPFIALLFAVYACRTSEVIPANASQATNTEIYRMGEIVIVGYGGRPLVKDAYETFNKYNLPVPLNKPEVYESVDEAPSPAKGMAAFQEEIRQAINAAASDDLRGTIYVEAIVDASGNIRSPKVLYGINEKYDRQALEAMQNSPAWNPGRVEGNPVSTRIVVPLVFGKQSTPYASLADLKELPRTPAAGGPIPQEGMEALYQYIQRHIKYPQEAKSNLIEGKVVIGFTVQKDGTLADIRIEESVFPALDAEVIRIIRESTLRWQPALENGQPAESRIVLPATFKLG